MIALWTGFTSWWSRNPIAQWITYIALALLGWEVVKRHLKEAGRQAERAAIAQKQAQAREAQVNRQMEVIREESQNADAALEARDSGAHYPTFDELPESHKRILNRSSGSDSGR